MKKFKAIKTIKSFEGKSLTREQMYHATGGLSKGTKGTVSSCHMDGTDDGDPHSGIFISK